MAKLPYGSPIRQIYHELNPHPALSPIPRPDDSTAVSLQSENERVYRQLLVQGALAVLLPTEDLQSTPLRTLVGDIIADLIIGQALAGKICEGWFLHETIAKIIANVIDKVQPKASGSELRDDAKSRLEKFGLLPSEMQHRDDHLPLKHQSTLSIWFWRIMQYGYLAFLFMRHVLKGLNQARSLPRRPRNPRGLDPSATISKTPLLHDLAMDEQSPQPVLGYTVYGMVSTVLDLAGRMPWLTSTFTFWQHMLLFGSGQIGASNSIVDR